LLSLVPHFIFFGILSEYYRRVAHPLNFDTITTEGAPPFAVFKGWKGMGLDQ
jgi:hypothetical protein